MLNQPSHICILGCGRSGTSIFGEFFQHLPMYTYYSEPPFSNLKDFDYSNPIAFKVPTPSDQQGSSFGLPFRMEQLWEVLPEPRVIFWQVRHPLDAICSLRVGIAKDWGHHPRPHDWQQWLEKPLLQRCAHHWNYINTRGYDQLKDVAVVNRFEEMILATEQAAHRICESASIDFSQYESFLRPWIDRVQDENNDRFIEAETSRSYSRPDHQKKVGRWEENLTEDEIASILPLIREGARNFGYVLPAIN